VRGTTGVMTGEKCSEPDGALVVGQLKASEEALVDVGRIVLDINATVNTRSIAASVRQRLVSDGSYLGRYCTVERAHWDAST
jgi:prophage tail gpP-like protein